MIGLVWAEAANGVIGADGALPWRLPEDTAHFKALTSGSTVVMGRATWESLPPRFRPLADRRNVVLTRRPGYEAPGAEVVHDLAAALSLPGDVWVIGGGEVYRAALAHADRLVVTELADAHPGDVTAPERGDGWTLEHRDPPSGWRTSRMGARFRISTWVR
ncbi:dihydrofolate reductase [Kineococcus sp. R8]|uniref:dihydrofolate reductase n=1 Tax=Kineococcus siccus TaxID=2696567 RepID=UPI0014134988|nr:dihydrofolate reductase [Kineococcus siccus]